MTSCDHNDRVRLDEDTEECTFCREVLCMHVNIDPQSNCVYCGQYVQEISIERPWSTNNFSFGSAKSSDHTKLLKALGADEEIIRQTMRKYSEIDNRMKNEIPVVAACMFLSFMDAGKPKTILEIASLFNSHCDEKLTRSKLQKALKSVYEVFPEYITKYITVSMMVPPLMEKLEIPKEYYEHINNIALFVQKNWSKCIGSKRSTPQNIAAVIIYKYIFRSPSLKTKYEPSKVVKKLGISNITLNNIEKILDRLVDFS